MTMSDGPVALSYVIKDDAERLENLQASIWNSSATEGSDEPANHSNTQRFIATAAFRKYPRAEALRWMAASPLSRRRVAAVASPVEKLRPLLPQCWDVSTGLAKWLFSIGKQARAGKYN